MREESVPNLIQTPGLAAIVAMLRKRAQQMEVKLPPDVALYIAQNVQSNASALEAALLRLAAHSSLTGTAITLTYTQRVLKDFIGAKARKVAVDCLQKLPAVARGTKEARIGPQNPTATDGPFVLCLLKALDGRKISRVRNELQVNMRESEREQLAGRDGYERELERQARKRSLA